MQRRHILVLCIARRGQLLLQLDIRKTMEVLSYLCACSHAFSHAAPCCPNVPFPPPLNEIVVVGCSYCGPQVLASVLWGQFTSERGEKAELVAHGGANRDRGPQLIYLCWLTASQTRSIKWRPQDTV
jgi:hypothetical protein